MDVAEEIQNALCKSVKRHAVRADVEAITTPFLDSSGYPVTVYVHDGEVTDGGARLNELRALRVFDEWERWPFRDDFLLRYNIEEREGSLVARDQENKADLLRYLQGTARLASYFDAKPLKEAPDRFPVTVKTTLSDTLRQHAPQRGRERWLKERLRSRVWKYKGLKFETDFWPQAEERMVQVVSNAGASSSVKREHVQSKLMPYEFYARKKQDVELYIILPSLSAYPKDARSLMEEEAKEVIEWRDTGAAERVARLLTARGRTASLID